MAFRLLILWLSIVASTRGLQAEELEVLHWWTSGGEARALDVLRSDWSKQGSLPWRDLKIPGGGGENALKALKARILAGNPPTAMQAKGPQTQTWAQAGQLRDLSPLAKLSGWEQKVPVALARYLRYEGAWVAVPIDVHRINWLFINPEVFKKAGAPLPRIFADLFTAADSIKKTGLLPFAHGGQAWQDATVFEAFFVALAGPKLYRRAFVDGDPSALTTPEAIAVFTAMRRYSTYLDPNRKGLAWDQATATLIAGKAGMQIMGDWVRSELYGQGKQWGQDFLCLAVPGSESSFVFNVDSFVFFNTSSAAQKKAQEQLATLIMSESLQERFNLRKGSLPALTTVNLAAYDNCAKGSMGGFLSAGSSGQLVPSFAHQMAMPAEPSQALMAVIAAHLNSDMSAEEAAKRLAQALKALKI